MCGVTQMNTDEHLCLVQGAKVQKALWNKCSTPHHRMEGGNTLYIRVIYKPINQMEAGKGSLKDLLIKMSFMQAKDPCSVIFPKFLLHVSSPFFPPHRELGSQP